MLEEGQERRRRSVRPFAEFRAWVGDLRGCGGRQGCPWAQLSCVMGDEGQVGRVGAGSRVRLERRYLCSCRRGNRVFWPSAMEKHDCWWALDGEKESGWLLWGRRTLVIASLLCSEQVGRRHGSCFVVCLAVSLGVLPTKLCLNPI